MSRRYMGVTSYVGLPGSGKTYSLAAVGLAAMARGRPVHANVVPGTGQPWLSGALPFASFDEFCAINEGVVKWSREVRQRRRHGIQQTKHQRQHQVDNHSPSPPPIAPDTARTTNSRPAP